MDDRRQLPRRAARERAAQLIQMGQHENEMDNRGLPEAEEDILDGNLEGEIAEEEYAVEDGGAQVPAGQAAAVNQENMQ